MQYISFYNDYIYHLLWQGCVMQDKRDAKMSRKQNKAHSGSRRGSAGSARRNGGKRKSNKTAVMTMFAITLMLLVVMSIAGGMLKQKAAVYQDRETQLEELILAEKDRTVSIESEKKYRQTLSFAEDVAREKLGLVYPNETIYKSDK